MYFVRSIADGENGYERNCSKGDLLLIKIDSVEVALVAFQTEDLADLYFDFSGIKKQVELIDEHELAPDILNEIAGENLFLVEDEMMIEEMGRRGAGFPFSEFVRPYEVGDRLS